MNYCNRVEGFINYVLSNSRNINGYSIRCPCKRCKNKNFINLDVVTMHLLQKEFMEKYLCWFAYGEPYFPYETLVKMMVGSTSSFSNVHEVVDVNSNPYQNMVTDAMRINEGYVGECSIVMKNQMQMWLSFFYLLKDSDEPLWDESINHSKLSIIAQVFTIKLDYGLSEVSYDRIVKRTRKIYLKGIG